MIDTGKNVPESIATLLHQQSRLERGITAVQMFPLGTPELRLPIGAARHENMRGVFHYNPRKITSLQIEKYSSQGMENEILSLGPYSKKEIADRLARGESLVFITEYTPVGVEVRSAAGTNVTADRQRAYFERTKEVGNSIVVGAPPDRVLSHLKKAS